MANGQFAVADVLGRFQQGQQFTQQQQAAQQQFAQREQLAQQQQQQFSQQNQQFQQQQALAPLKLQSAQLGVEQQQQTLDARTDKQKNQSLFNTALSVDSASDEQIIPILEASIARVKGLGGDAKESMVALELARSGDFDTIRSRAKNLIDIGVRQGDIKAPAVKKLSSLQQKVEAEGLDPFTPAGQARAREITQGSRTDPSLKPSDQQALNKATEGQLTSSVFANRVKESNSIISDLEKIEGFNPTSIQSAFIQSIPGGNIALSDEHQQYIQAKRDIISAVLRKQSGAVISDSEFENEDKKLFPQVGDSAAVKAQKAKARNREFENLKAQSKGVFSAQFEGKAGALSKAEQAELQQLRAEFGGQ